MCSQLHNMADNTAILQPLAAEKQMLIATNPNPPTVDIASFQTVPGPRFPDNCHLYLKSPSYTRVVINPLATLTR